MSVSVKPGDFVYVVDLENLKIQRNKIYGVQITADGKLSISEGKYSPYIEPGSNYFFTKEEAEEKIRQEKSKFPIRNFWEHSGTVEWFKPDMYLPRDGEEVLVTTKRGTVRSCVFLSEWTFQEKEYRDIFISFHRKPHIVQIKSWAFMPQADR